MDPKASVLPTTPQRHRAPHYDTVYQNMRRNVKTLYFATSSKMFVLKCLCAVRYKGCYLEAQGARTFSVSAGSYNPTTLTPTTCTAACLRWGYRYAAMTQGSYCFCNNNLPTVAAVTPDTPCNVPCSGNSTFKCGGNVTNQYIR